MQRSQDPRIDLAELKLHILKKIGVERSRRYFYYLGRFLSQKLTKSEFDKSCCRLLEKENLALHNKFIRLILRNASLAKSPPHRTGHPDKSLVVGKEDEPEQSGSKVRSGMCVGATRDRPAPLRPKGKVENMANGDLGPFGYRKCDAFLCPAEKLRIPDKFQVTAPVSRADEAEEEQGRLIIPTSLVSAPIGIPFCPGSVGGARRTVPISTRAGFNSGGLSDAEMLRKRMENIAVAMGLEGVSPECSNMLNNMLEVYMKKLIKSCINLAGARSINGLQTSTSLLQPSNQPLDITKEQHPVSLLVFRVAMELNPHQLGENWPLLQERISMRSFEDREGL